MRVLQGPLATDDSEFSSVLVMTGISVGKHTVRVELYESWSKWERSAADSREVIVEYFPVKREDRLVRVPIVRSVVGVDLAIVSDAEKQIYREMDEGIKKEVASRRDAW